MLTTDIIMMIMTMTSMAMMMMMMIGGTWEQALAANSSHFCTDQVSPNEPDLLPASSSSSSLLSSSSSSSSSSLGPGWAGPR